MWRPCIVVFDETIMLLLWEWDEALLFLGVFFLGQFVLGPFVSGGVALALALLTYYLKRGKPAGAVLHWLHRADIYHLPGVLPLTEARYTTD